MTEAQQKRFYFPVWNRCREALGLPNGRVADAKLAELEAEMKKWPEPAGPAGLQVVAWAKQVRAELATPAEATGVSAEDLRHACNLVATGKESSQGLNNAETNRVVALMRLLADPDDLDAVMDWLHPDEVERRGLKEFIRKQAPEGLLSRIFANAYGTIFWEDGDKQQLRWLLKQVKGRGATSHRAACGGAKSEEAECPF